jgi:hypothetical protein
LRESQISLEKNTQYQVRSDQAIRRHWQLVCCAFSFCWYHSSHSSSRTTDALLKPTEPKGLLETNVPAKAVGTGKKISENTGMRPRLSWPVALRMVRAWLEPWVLLWRYWRAWSKLPPPLAFQSLLEEVEQGHGLFLYETF